MGVHFSTCFIRGVEFPTDLFDDWYKEEAFCNAVGEMEGVEAGWFGDMMSGDTSIVVYEKDDFVKLTDDYGGYKFGVIPVGNLVYKFLEDKKEFPILAHALETLRGLGYPYKTVADLDVYYCSNVN